MWDGQIAALKDRYQVIVWDFRGHGESDYPKDGAQYSEALTVGDMLALLDPVGGRRRSSPACRSAATCRSPSTPAIPSGCGR